MPKKPRKPSNPFDKILCVQILEAKPNTMFSEGQRSSIRFLRYNRFVPCAACGKKLRIHWTMLYEFKAGDMEQSTVELQWFPKSFAPLTPVCGDHPLMPAFVNKPHPSH